LYALIRSADLKTYRIEFFSGKVRKQSVGLAEAIEKASRPETVYVPRTFSIGTGTSDTVHRNLEI